MNISILSVTVALMILFLKDSTLPIILLFGFFFCFWFLDFHIFLWLLFSFFHRCFCWWWFGLLCWFRWFWCFSFFIFWHLKNFELEFQVLKVNSSKIKDCFVTLEYWMVEIQSSIAMEIKRRIHKLSYFQCTFLKRGRLRTQQESHTDHDECETASFVLAQDQHFQSLVSVYYRVTQKV